MRCIYCLLDLEVDVFNREHVMPQAFGKFAQNLTLVDVVCRDCNQHFGDGIDRIFGRDSFEAYKRIIEGVKPKTEMSEVAQRRLTFSVAEEGELRGLRLRLSYNGGRLTTDLVPQVGFQRKGTGEWEYFTEEEITDWQKPLPSEPTVDGIRIIGDSDEAVGQLINSLERRGVTFQKQGNLALPNPTTEDIAIFINSKIDPAIKRCAAKIVFNYLAYTAGRDFLLHKEFDITRDYIRFENSPDYTLVEADDAPILANDKRTRRQTNGHLVTVNWTVDNQNIVGQLSMFNHVRYSVSLARHFSGVWRPIRSGHHFDLSKREISPLTATSLITLG